MLTRSRTSTSDGERVFVDSFFGDSGSLIDVTEALIEEKFTKLYFAAIRNITTPVRARLTIHASVIPTIAPTLRLLVDDDDEFGSLVGDFGLGHSLPQEVVKEDGSAQSVCVQVQESVQLGQT